VPSPASAEAHEEGRWWITTERFERGGQKVLGPFVSRDAALTERVSIEKADGVSYWVDEEPGLEHANAETKGGN
jgi:hypothetical protein